MQAQLRATAVIPAYNEAATIREVALRTLQQVSDVTVVDDGSTDDTAGRVADLPLRLLRHPENQGKAASLWSGMQAALQAGSDFVITLDGDGQHAPEDIPRLVAEHHAHPLCIIIGARVLNREAAPRLRRFANRFADFWISWAAGHRIRDSQSGFRLYPTPVLQRVHLPHDKAHSFVLESEILIEAAQLGFGCRAVPIATCYPPQARKSHFRPLADIAAIVRMVAGHLLARGMNPRGLYRLLSARD
jgi:glycosyltransferase involved in cell wall biosynthesis